MNVFGQPDNNPNNLRVIKTARTEKAINKAAKKRLRPLVKPVIPGPDIHNMVAVYQHRETGEIELSGDMRYAPSGDYDCIIPFQTYYPYSFPEPFAAYLVPKDIKEGEKVWLEDIIEDIISVHGNQGWNPRLDAYEAIWKDGDFEILFDPEKDALMLVG